MAAEPWEIYQAGAPAQPVQEPWEAYQAKPAAGTDIVRGAIQGLTHDLPASIAGLPGDVSRLGANIGGWMGNQIRPMLGEAPLTAAQQEAVKQLVPGYSTLPSSQDVSGMIDKALPSYDPTTTAGKIARTAAGFLPAAALPGGLLARATRPLLAGASSELAGEATQGSPLELPARMLAPMLTGGLGEAAAKPLDSFLSRIEPVPGVASSFGAGGVRLAPPQTPVDPTIVKLAERSKATPQVLQQRVQDYRAEGLDPLTFQALGEPGAYRAAALARNPGETPQLAADVIKAKRSDTLGILQKSADTAFGSQSKPMAEADIDAGFAALSPQYNDLLDNSQVPPATWNRTVQPVLNRLQNAGDLNSIMPQLQANAARDGVDLASVTPARQAHYVKMALGDMIDTAPQTGIGPVTKRSMTQAKVALDGALEQAVPGYQKLNAQWKDLASSQDMLDFADNVFGMGKASLSPEEVSNQVSTMTPLQKQMAQTSLRARARTMFAARAKEGVAKTDLTTPLMNSEMFGRFRAVLGPQAEPFLRSLKTQEQTFKDTGFVMPRGGSPTEPLFAEMMDQHAAVPSKEKVISGLLRSVAGKVGESQRNKLGGLLFSDFTQEQQDALSRELARRAAARQAQAVAPALAAADRQGK